MINFKTKLLGILPFQTIWFAKDPRGLISRFRIYKQATTKDAKAGFVRQPFYTKIINLSVSAELILQGMDKQTLYESRRATKEGIQTTVEPDISQFIIFYNLFASHKHLPFLTDRFYKYCQGLLITKAVFQDIDLIMHAYVVDREIGRARLLYSASATDHYSKQYTEAFKGRANRLLHINDIKMFRAQGFKSYDLGGYALGTSDPALSGINKFKDSFGGELIEESDYIPIPLDLMLSKFTL